MVSSRGLQQLCETWWTHLADSPKEEYRRFTGQFFELLGWTGAQPLDAAVPPVPEGTASYMARASGETAIAVYFVAPGLLDPPSSVVNQGLDFCDATRRLVDSAYASKANYAFITDVYRSYLYNAATEELLLYADTPAEFGKELAQVLQWAEIEQGVLEDIRRQPRSVVARQLREWCHRWCATFTAHFRVPEPVAILVIDRLLVLKFLLDQGASTGPGFRYARRFAELLAAAGDADHGPKIGKELKDLFQDMWANWKTGLFADMDGLDDALNKEALIGPLLSEFRLLSQTKFTIPSLLESFNYGEAAEKARVRMIPEENEERSAYLAKQMAETIDGAQIGIDLEEEGYRAIFHWFDRLVGLYSRLDRDYEIKERRQDPMSHEDMDLIAWSESNARSPRAFSDKLRHAIESGLVVYCASERQRRTARLLLYFHLISRSAQQGESLDVFPNVEAALQKRPSVLESDRKQTFDGPGLGGRSEVI